MSVVRGCWILLVYWAMISLASEWVPRSEGEVRDYAWSVGTSNSSIVAHVASRLLCQSQESTLEQPSGDHRRPADWKQDGHLVAWRGKRGAKCRGHELSRLRRLTSCSRLTAETPFLLAFLRPPVAGRSPPYEVGLEKEGGPNETGWNSNQKGSP